MPVITAAPAIIAALILLTYSLRIFEAYRPTWTKPFLQEKKQKTSDEAQEQTHLSLTATLSLLATTLIGLALQIMTVFFPERQVIEVYPAMAWVCSFRVYASWKRLIRL
jgi:hypothetical protein